MAETCRPAKCIEAIRVALLDQCGISPVEGPFNGYAMGCIIDADWTPEIEEGDESLVKSDCGDICLQDLRCDQLKRHSMEFKIANPDWEFLALIGGDNRIVNGGQTVGVQHTTQKCSPWLFVELFEKTDDCVGGIPVYFRHVFPKTRLTWTGNEKEGIFRLLQIEGKTQPVLISDIGDGPYNDIPAYAISAAPGERSDYIEFEDTVVPVVQCGAITVPAQ